MMRGIAEDLRYAARGLRRSPAFAFTAIVTLALGIGINAAVFTLSNAVLFSGFPSVEDNERIVYIASDRSACCLSYPDFLHWRTQATSFEGMAVVHGISVSLSDATGYPESRDATEVSAETFSLVGARPMLGRDFASSDQAPGAAPVAILSYGFWERRYGRDPAIVGRVIRVNGTPTTVIGVMPEGFAFPQKQDLWIPLALTPGVLSRDSRDLWFAFARLAEGATLESARAEMAVIGERLAREYPDDNRDYLPAVRTFNEFFIGASETAVYKTMWGAVAFVLLIACANLANLMLARAMGRTREISVRVALGAGRWRIARQLLTESLMLAVAGGALGWWIAKAVVHLYSLAERGPGFASWRVLDYTMDYRILAYLAAITIATGVLFGLAPVGRLSKLDVNASLKDGDRGGGARVGGARLSSLLVTAEVALAVVLLTGAGLMAWSYFRISTLDSGVTTDDVLAAYVQLPASRYPRTEDQTAFFEHLERGIEALPGVESVTFASALPTWGTRPVPYDLTDQLLGPDGRRPEAAALVVGPDYFRTLGAALLAGREFQGADDPAHPPVAIVNEHFASNHWPGEQAVGQRLRLFEGATPGPWLTVVGVASNIVQATATRPPFEPIVYVSNRQTAQRGLWVLARSRVAPANLANDFRREVQVLDADLPVMLGPYPLEDRMAEGYWDSELYAVVFLIFGATALTLAALGIYAIVSCAVSRQTQEIGVRVAIGASARHILGLAFRHGMIPVGVGILIGGAVSLAVARVLESMLAKPSPAEPIAFALAAGVLVLVALLGCWIPGRRAMRIDPVAALRAH
jgi:predicted permease